jgi:hypothetical protein
MQTQMVREAGLASQAPMHLKPSQKRLAFSNAMRGTAVQQHTVARKQQRCVTPICIEMRTQPEPNPHSAPFSPSPPLLQGPKYRVHGRTRCQPQPNGLL